jgi:hypothetical protein
VKTLPQHHICDVSPGGASPRPGAQAARPRPPTPIRPTGLIGLLAHQSDLDRVRSTLRIHRVRFGNVQLTRIIRTQSSNCRFDVSFVTRSSRAFSRCAPPPSPWMIPRCEVVRVFDRNTGTVTMAKRLAVEG